MLFLINGGSDQDNLIRRLKLETRELLLKVKNGAISIEEAENYFRKINFLELGYAKLDFNRKIRTGFPEVIFCSGKTEEQLLKIFAQIYEAEGEALGTRASSDQYQLIHKLCHLLIALQYINNLQLHF